MTLQKYHLKPLFFILFPLFWMMVMPLPLIAEGCIEAQQEARITVETSFGKAQHGAINAMLGRYSKREWGYQLNRILADASFYKSYIEERIEALQLPPELFYLPVVESRYINQSQSHMGAMGIWQFMKTSATPLGLYINDERDERRDFMKATDAALRKLKINYHQTGDWLLAIAAYNCGLGAVQRAMKKTGATTFWELYDSKILPTETLNYIPKFLAVLYIMQHPAEFGINKLPQPIKWTKIAILSPIPLEKLAQYSGIDYQLLRKANQELNQDLTPCDGKPYFLKVPEKYEKKIQSAIKNIPTVFANEDIDLDKTKKPLYYISEYEKA